MPIRKVTDPALLQQLGSPGGVVAPNPMFPGQMQAQQLGNAEKQATLPYAAPKAAADASNAATQARVNAATALPLARAEVEKTRAEAEKARAELEKTRMDQPDAKQRQNAIALLRAAGVDLEKGIDPIAPLISGSTSGRAQHLGAEAYGAVTGHATHGMENIGKLQTVVSDLVLQLTDGGLGNQISNADREFIMQRVGNLADPNVPADQRLAAWEQVKTRMGNILGVRSQNKELTPEAKAQFFDIMQRDGPDAADEYLQKNFGLRMKDKGAANRPYSKDLAGADSYSKSYLSQALSGANEGIASVLGAPVDLATAAINLVPQGLNAVANTNIPQISDPVAGGDWWKRRLSDIGSILPGSDDPSKQFVRRTGESVGASAIPAFGAGGSAARIGAGLLSGLGGGIGAATAQQAAPGNPLAEFAGEIAGGGITGAGLAKYAQRAAQRQIESKIPTIADLQDKASQLYQAADANGITAKPQQTRTLAAAMRQTLRNEGQLGPKGKITNADTNVSKAFNLVQQYAGREMKPSEMNTVRKVLADSRGSSDASDRRLGSILLKQFDDWVSPLAPEFDQARAVSSRYLQAQDLERARELAGAKASQFTGSGFENALRTEYRNLDRNAIKGNNYFSDDVNDAIEKVSRGTPASNFLRGVGKLAPTGIVSGAGSVVPALTIGASAGSPTLGGLVGGGLAGAGILGRVGATRMGIRAADEAEMIARNGGPIEQASILPPTLRNLAAWLALSQVPKYANSNQH